MKNGEFAAEHGASVLSPADGAYVGSRQQERPATEEYYGGLYPDWVGASIQVEKNRGQVPLDLSSFCFFATPPAMWGRHRDECC